MDDEDIGALYNSAPAHVEYPAEVVIDGTPYRAGIQAAGATTVLNPRKSFTLKLKGDALYRGTKEIRLAAAVGDRSMIRPLLSFEMFASAGVPASWAEHAFVHLNERILGVYIAIESVEDEYFTNRGIAWSRIFSAKGDADFGKSFEGRLDRAFDSKPKPANLATMISVLRTLDFADDTEFAAGLFRIFDRTSVVNYMAAAQVINHFDGFNKNLFYYQTPVSNRLHLVPWDLDLTWPTRNEDAWNQNVLFTRIGRISSLRSEIDARITALIAGPFAKATLLARITAIKTGIRDGFEHDPWLGRAGISLDERAAELADRLSERVDNLP